MFNVSGFPIRPLAAAAAIFALGACGGSRAVEAPAPVPGFVRGEPGEVQELFNYRQIEAPVVSSQLSGTPPRTVLRHARALLKAQGYGILDYDEDRVELVTDYRPAEPKMYRITGGPAPASIRYRLELVHSRYVQEPVYTIGIRFQLTDAPTTTVVSTGERELAVMNELRRQFGLTAMAMPRTNLPERGVRQDTLNWDARDAMRRAVGVLDSSRAR